jgi:Uma2 family endonuclease
MRTTVSDAPPESGVVPRRLTLEEWADLPEDDEGELVDGILVEEEMGGLAHESVVGWIIEVLRAWIAGRGGRVAASELKIAVAALRGRKPDVVAWLPGHRPLPRRGLIRRPPDLVVEVLSSRPRDHRRDRVEKVAEYAAFGVRWYWLVDPDACTLEILERGADGRYVQALAAGGGCIESVPGCDGLVLDLDALWAELDGLVDEPDEV